MINLQKYLVIKVGEIYFGESKFYTEITPNVKEAKKFDSEEDIEKYLNDNPHTLQSVQDRISKGQELEICVKYEINEIEGQ